MTFLAHRIVWASWETSTRPGETIDHWDRDGLNNRPINLREATPQQQSANTGLLGNSTTKLKGVDWHKKTGKYRARIKVNGKTRDLGELVAPQQHPSPTRGQLVSTSEGSPTVL